MKQFIRQWADTLGYTIIKMRQVNGGIWIYMKNGIMGIWLSNENFEWIKSLPYDKQSDQMWALLG